MIGARKVMRGKGVSRKTRSGDEIIKNQSIRAASKRRTFTSALVIFLIAALFLTGTVWGTISFIDANSLRIYINRRNVGTISLSESEDFNSPTSVIRMQGPEQMTNTTYEWIEQAGSVLGREGNHHEENVIAYSFYLRNMGETAIYYTSTIVLNQLSRDVENALRIIVVEEAEPGSDVEAAPEEGVRPPQRPRLSVRVASAGQDDAGRRHQAVHGVDIVPVGQRRDGVAHGAHQGGVRARPHVRDARPGRHGDLRVHRVLLQPGADPLRPGEPQPRGARGVACGGGRPEGGVGV